MLSFPLSSRKCEQSSTVGFLMHFAGRTHPRGMARNLHRSWRGLRHPLRGLRIFTRMGKLPPVRMEKILGSGSDVRRVGAFGGTTALPGADRAPRSLRPRAQRRPRTYPAGLLRGQRQRERGRGPALPAPQQPPLPPGARARSHGPGPERPQGPTRSAAGPPW